MSSRFRTTVRLIALGAFALGLAWWLWPAPGAGEGADRGDNGLWMRRHWIHGGSVAVAELVPQLEGLGIRRIYPFLGPMDAEGHPGWRSDEGIVRYQDELAGTFFADMERLAPEVRVIPWTGGVYQRDVFLGDERLRQAFVDHLHHLTKLGADGVQLNVEPLPTGHPDYLSLLEEAKAAIGPDKVLSVAAYPPTTVLHPYDDVHWDMDYTREVCLRADELVVMAYDTALRSPRIYEGLVARWVGQYLDTLPPPEEGGCEILFGLPAYEDDEPWHHPGTETLEHGIRGVLRGLKGRTTPPHFRGIAVYASWTTDAAEWASYDELWRDRSPTGLVITEVPGS